MKTDVTNRATIIQNSKDSAIIADQPASGIANVTKSIYRGDKYITVSNTKNMKAGQLFYLKSDKLWYWDDRGYLTKGELNRIQSIDGNKVYLERPADEGYSISNENLNVTTYPLMSVTISNIIFTHPTAVDGVLLKISHVANSNFSRLSVNNSKTAGLILYTTYKSNVTNSYFDLGTTKDITSGYGLQDYGGTDNVFTYNTFKHVRRGIDFSGVTPSRYGLAEYNTSYGPDPGVMASGDSGFGTHSTAEYITFKYNTIYGFSYAFNNRGNHNVIENNKHYGNAKAFVGAGHGGNMTLNYNTYDKQKSRGYKNFVISFGDYEGFIRMYGNSANGVYESPIYLGSKNINSLYLMHNTFTSTASKTSQYFLDSPNHLYLTNCKISQNKFTVPSSVKKFFKTDTIDTSSSTNTIYNTTL
jgi:hypothetical protein